MNSKLFSFFIGRDILTHLGGLLVLLGFLTSGYVCQPQKNTEKPTNAPDSVFNQANYVSKLSLVYPHVIIAFTLIPNFYDHPPVVVLETFFIILIYRCYTLSCKKNLSKTDIQLSAAACLSSPIFTA
jgi:potassium efflux system protein